MSHPGRATQSRYVVDCISVYVLMHPNFQDWLEKLASIEGLQEVFGEVMALIAALEEYGRELGPPESHPVHGASYDLHALRRTPPTNATPYAQAPPVLRVLYGFVEDQDGNESAVLAVGGDKTRLGNAWYPANITQAQDRIDQWCQHNQGYKPVAKRGGTR